MALDRIGIAKQVLNFLDTPKNRDKWADTTTLLNILKLPMNKRPSALKILHQLADKGVLAKRGDGKIRWARLERGAAYNPDNPFLLAKTTAVTKAKPEQLDDFPMPEGLNLGDLDEAWVLPKVFTQVASLCSARRNVLLVGPAGCGKTTVAELIAQAMDLQFGALSCTSGMSEAHLLGRSIPDFHEGKSRFQGTQFLKCYEEGGVFLLDELDAADPNLLLAINTALANDYCNVPNRPENPRAERHEDFVLIASANTYGRGATRTYAGRNQLDEATIDRFRIGLVECEYDTDVEEQVCPDDKLRKLCQAIRDKINTNGLRRIMSTRFMADAHTMLKAGWKYSQILMTYFGGWSKDELAKLDVSGIMASVQPAPEPAPSQPIPPAAQQRPGQMATLITAENLHKKPYMDLSKAQLMNKRIKSIASNKYAGTCVVTGLHVPVNCGYVRRMEDGNWQTISVEGWNQECVTNGLGAMSLI